jgi:hypothetical protein
MRNWVRLRWLYFPSVNKALRQHQHLSRLSQAICLAQWPHQQQLCLRPQPPCHASNWQHHSSQQYQQQSPASLVQPLVALRCLPLVLLPVHC